MDGVTNKAITGVNKAIKTISAVKAAKDFAANPNITNAAALGLKAADSLEDLKNLAGAGREDSVLGQIAKKTLAKFSLPGSQEALAAASQDAQAAAKLASRSQAQDAAKQAVEGSEQRQTQAAGTEVKDETDRANENTSLKPAEVEKLQKSIQYTEDLRDISTRESLQAANKPIPKNLIDVTKVGNDHIQSRFIRMHNFTKLDKKALAKDGKDLKLSQDQMTQLLKDGKIKIKGEDGKEQEISKNQVDIRFGKSQLNADQFKTFSANLGFLVKKAENSEGEKAAAQKLDSYAKSSQDALSKAIAGDTNLQALIGDKASQKSFLTNADNLSAIAERFLKVDPKSKELVFDSAAANKELASPEGKQFLRMLAEDYKHTSRTDLGNLSDRNKRFDKAKEVNNQRFTAAAGTESAQLREELAKVGINEENMAYLDGRAYEQGARAIRDLSSDEGIDALVQRIKDSGENSAKITLSMQTDYDTRHAYANSARGMEAARSAANNANQLIIPINGEKGFKAVQGQLEKLAVKLQEAGIKTDVELAGFFHAGGGTGVVSKESLAGDEGRIDKSDTDITDTVARLADGDGDVDVTCAACNFGSTTKSLAESTAAKQREINPNGKGRVTYTSTTDTSFAKLDGKNLLSDDSVRIRNLNEDGKVEARDQFTNDASSETLYGVVAVNQAAREQAIKTSDPTGLVSSGTDRSDESISGTTRDDFNQLPPPNPNANNNTVDDDSGNIDPASLAGTNNEANKEWEMAGASS